jgi:sensor histidine kinase regulating citrate/malate metabolism
MDLVTLVPYIGALLIGYALTTFDKKLEYVYYELAIAVILVLFSNLSSVLIAYRITMWVIFVAMFGMILGIKYPIK